MKVYEKELETPERVRPGDEYRVTWHGGILPKRRMPSIAFISDETGRALGYANKRRGDTLYFPIHASGISHSVKVNGAERI